MKRVLTFIVVFIMVFDSFLCFNLKAYAESTELAFFDYLLQATENHKTKVNISSYMKENSWSMNDLKQQLKYFYLSEPLLFYVDRDVIIHYSSDYSKVYLQFKYNYSEEESDEMVKALNKSALKAIKGIDNDMTVAEKALVVHDYIILNCDYDYDEKNYSAYDCLVSKSAVCQGYSLAYLYIMRDVLGLNCSVVFSDSQSHSWNYLKIGKYWYHVDLTSDDPTFTTFDGTRYDAKGEVLHENFLLSDTAFYKTSGLHRKWDTMGLPEAKNTKYDDFFWKKTTSAMYKVSGLWYYTLIDETSPGMNYKASGDKTIYTKICTYNFETKKKSVVKKIKTIWYVYRDKSTGKAIEGKSWYKKSYTKLTCINNKLYFNTPTSVYKLDTESGKANIIYTLSKKNMQIFSIVPYSNSKIRIVYKKDLSYANNYLKLKVS